MIMPHLLHARSRSKNDASIAKTLPRTLDLRIRCKFDNMVVESKTFQERLRKLNRKRKVDEFQAFDKQMESGKISRALRCLPDDAKGGVISASYKMFIEGRNCTVLDLLQEKHPCSQKADSKNVVTDPKYGICSFILLFLKKLLALK